MFASDIWAGAEGSVPLIISGMIKPNLKSTSKKYISTWIPGIPCIAEESAKLMHLQITVAYKIYNLRRTKSDYNFELLHTTVQRIEGGSQNSLVFFVTWSEISILLLYDLLQRYFCAICETVVLDLS